MGERRWALGKIKIQFSYRLVPLALFLSNLLY
jgi:hypothetical protein